MGLAFKGRVNDSPLSLWRQMLGWRVVSTAGPWASCFSAWECSRKIFKPNANCFPSESLPSTFFFSHKRSYLVLTMTWKVTCCNNLKVEVRGKFRKVDAELWFKPRYDSKRWALFVPTEANLPWSQAGRAELALPLPHLRPWPKNQASQLYFFNVPHYPMPDHTSISFHDCWNGSAVHASLSLLQRPSAL